MLGLTVDDFALAADNDDDDDDDKDIMYGCSFGRYNKSSVL